MVTVSCQMALNEICRDVSCSNGYTPSASAVAVKVILVGAGETRSPTRLKALATDSLAKNKVNESERK